MVHSRIKLMFLGLWLATGAQAAPQLAPNQPITVDAASGDYQYEKDHLNIHHVKITQGTLSVSADESTGSALQFDDSHWRFTGHVQFTSAEGSLDSDLAEVVFLKNQLTSIEATGTPAHFQGTHANKAVQGHANRITYNPKLGTVALEGDASLNDGDNEIRGALLNYNFNEKHLSAGPSDQKDQHITITITPKSRPSNDNGEAHP